MIGLVVAIVAAILIGKAVGGAATHLPSTAGTGSAAGSFSAAPDDGEHSPAAAPAPSTSPGAPDPRATALAFTRAWLRHTGVSADAWLAGLSGLSTARLRDQLTGVDPAGVPAARITGSPTLVPHDASFVEVAVPVDAGALTLRLLATNGRWLVDGIDWQRS